MGVAEAAVTKLRSQKSLFFIASIVPMSSCRRCCCSQSFLEDSYSWTTGPIIPRLPESHLPLTWNDCIPFATLKHCNSIDWPVLRIEYHWIYLSSNASDHLLAFLMSGLERTHFEFSINSQCDQLWTGLQPNPT